MGQKSSPVCAPAHKANFIGGRLLVRRRSQPAPQRPATAREVLQTLLQGHSANVRITRCAAPWMWCRDSNSAR